MKEQFLHDRPELAVNSRTTSRWSGCCAAGGMIETHRMMIKRELEPSKEETRENAALEKYRKGH